MVFGIDDAAIAALATVTAGALQGGGAAMGGAAQGRAMKKQAKETKRQTLADLYKSALQREFDLYRFGQEQGGNNTARRAAALQEAANGFTRALR